MRRELENWGFGVWDVWRDERKMVALPVRWRAQCFMAPGWRREGHEHVGWGSQSLFVYQSLGRFWPSTLAIVLSNIECSSSSCNSPECFPHTESDALRCEGEAYISSIAFKHSGNSSQCCITIPTPNPLRVSVISFCFSLPL